MSKREDIVQKMTDLIGAMRTVKLGVVSRDPIIPEELPKTGFPSVHIEGTNEERIPLASNMYESAFETELVITVNGKERDKQRNVVMAAIEKTLMEDTDLQALVNEMYISRVENIEIGEGAPYASIRMIVFSRYCYTI